MEAPENVWVLPPAWKLRPIAGTWYEDPTVESESFIVGNEAIRYTRSDLAQKRIEELEALLGAEGNSTGEAIKRIYDERNELSRQGYILAMRVMGSDLVLTEEETSALNALIRYVPGWAIAAQANPTTPLAGA